MFDVIQQVAGDKRRELAEKDTGDLSSVRNGGLSKFNGCSRYLVCSIIIYLLQSFVQKQPSDYTEERKLMAKQDEAYAACLNADKQKVHVVHVVIG